MYDDIERIDNLAGVRPENSLNPLVRSTKEKRRKGRSPEDEQREPRKKHRSDEFVSDQAGSEGTAEQDRGEPPESEPVSDGGQDRTAPQEANIDLKV